MWYGYTSEQHTAVDAELATMWARLIEIAAEIERLAAETNKQGHTYKIACQSADKVAELRDALDHDEKNQRMIENIRKSLGRDV